MTDTIDPTISEPLALSDSPENAIAWERVPYNAADYGPVSDFATDFDHADKEYNPNAPEVWKELRDSGCPVAHSDRYGGMWTPITHEAVQDVAYDTENFTSRSVVVSHARPGDAAIPAPIGVVPPISSDPPFHNLARRLLLPPFAPKQIEPWEDEIRALCTRLLDEMGDIAPGDTVVDAAIQYAQHIPVNVIGRMLGFPEADEALFREFVHNTLETINAPTADRQENFQKLDAYLDAQVQDHIDNPREDLTDYLLNVELGGEKLSQEHVRGSMVLLLIAGIDTTWSAIGSSLWHLAQTPADLPAANRDPRVFEDADQFIIDRESNRHAAFGLGIHRCLGSNLARLELKVAIEEFVKRFPKFELAGDVSWSVGQIRGPRVLPVRILETA
jgi:cytochrome P450